ncbi:MAG: hypothetical protein JST93_01945 [Acidobacteria bacterium]|nr:hypothetical protein [Acidobacteriota bacterium]
MLSYPLEQLHQEVAYIAYHFHWTRDEIFEFPHPERRRWVTEIARINEEMNQENQSWNRT